MAAGAPRVQMPLRRGRGKAVSSTTTTSGPDPLTACLDANGTYICTAFNPRCYIIQKVRGDGDSSPYGNKTTKYLQLIITQNRLQSRLYLVLLFAFGVAKYNVNYCKICVSQFFFGTKLFLLPSTTRLLLYSILDR